MELVSSFIDKRCISHEEPRIYVIGRLAVINVTHFMLDIKKVTHLRTYSHS